ncbi:MAG: tRNA uridine-5-carboxymethylaminomethyl(34) synthesis GTPase MnmE [Muribaculaceae bacterium]|nr:tRNA uridine-5-carboxymethylaminomethyl(34) synthesis GTPase MnmE [Muribaculaceae bacterium]
MNTICAISTPHGTGGIAVARISGPEAFEIADRIWKGKRLSDATSHTAHYGCIIDPEQHDDPELDHGVATVFRAPRSFTGENIVELAIHGSPWLQRELINLLIRQGARLAEPGEFSRRAFTNGRLDLAEAEAVADMIATSSRAAHRIAMSHMRGDLSRKLSALRDDLLRLCALLELELDFSEEDVTFADRNELISLASHINHTVSAMARSFATGNALKNGINTAIVGATNAGKSTLLNRLLNDDKAIVSPIHGTTRDTIEDTAEINGRLYRFIDTAGLRHTDDPIECIGISRSIAAISKADIIIWMIDPENPDTQTPAHFTNSNTPIIAVVNKADLGLPHPAIPIKTAATITLSALADVDITPLTDALATIANIDDTTAEITITNARHYQALNAATQSTQRAIEALSANIPADLVAQDLRETIHHLSSITGTITTPDILTHIFSHFCIGK